MRINTNINSLLARNELAAQAQQSHISMERLTTGKRINTAADDAAGLAVATGLRADFIEAGQASRNANDAISWIQTADGGMEAVGDALQRMRELMVQAASDTYTSGDRQAIAQEAEQMVTAIGDIATRTRFNGQSVYDASGGLLGDPSQLPGTGPIEYALQTWWVPEAEARIKEAFGLDGQGVEIAVEFYTEAEYGTLAYVAAEGADWDPTAGAGGAGAYTKMRMALDLADFDGTNLPDGGDGTPMYEDRIVAHEMVHAIMNANMNTSALPSWFKEGASEFLHGADERVATDYDTSWTAGQKNTFLGAIETPPLSSQGYTAAYIAVKKLHADIVTAGNADGIKALMSELTNGSSFDAAINTLTGGTFIDALAFTTDFKSGSGAAFADAMNVTDADTGSILGSEYGGPVLDAEGTLPNEEYPATPQSVRLTGIQDFSSSSSSLASSSVSIFLGSEEGNSLDVGIMQLSAGALGLVGIDFTDHDRAIEQLDFAIEAVSKGRGELGAVSNRLEIVINGLATKQLHAAASRSRIEDADFAMESAQLSRHQVLAQASQAMLAQANSAPRQVLQLLQN